MRFTITWTDDMDAALKHHRAAGMFYKDIAKLIGVTKNAVIGRARRLNTPKVIGYTLADTPAKGCHFPVTPDSAGPKEHRFCGARRINGSSYCHKHHKIAYRTPPERAKVNA